MRGTKLEGNFKKMKGKVTAESEHTITIQPKAGKTTILSKRDVAKVNEGACTSAMKQNEETSTSAQKPFKAKKAKKQKVAAAKKKPVWEEMAEREFFRGRLASNEGGEKEEQIEPEQQEESAEANSADESTIPANEEKEMKTTESMEEEKNKEKKVPVKGQIKWEKVAQRSSTRTQKKPDWLGNNIMVTKIEQESSVGESLPSVYEISPPQ